jgi:hypothetical protein
MQGVGQKLFRLVICLSEVSGNDAALLPEPNPLQSPLF